MLHDKYTDIGHTAKVDKIAHRGGIPYFKGLDQGDLKVAKEEKNGEAQEKGKHGLEIVVGIILFGVVK